jgi:RNA recognition motif-containing protein
MKNIFVGNLSCDTKPEVVRSLFEPLGTVRKFKLMIDRHTGLSRGFAFVWMTEAEAGHAIAALDGSTIAGRTIEVRAGRQRLRRDAAPAVETPSGNLPA